MRKFTTLLLFQFAIFSCLGETVNRQSSDTEGTIQCSEGVPDQGLLCYNQTETEDGAMKCFPMTFSDILDGFLDSIGVAGLVVLGSSALLYLILLLTAIAVLMHRQYGGKGKPGPSAKLCKMYGKAMNN
ncbi:hypothetical protein RI129_010854 [Pyrocoelia pectoralis]|uniref:Uncharacterized protein n=1 Tax=Pyrocoelia pectoralis TaxID=417401 RepID=A0AAN7ZIA6_9COLE